MSDITYDIVSEEISYDFPCPAEVDVQTWMEARPAYTSNGEAKTAFETLYGVGNAVGKTYWAAFGHDAAQPGSFMRVVSLIIGCFFAVGAMAQNNVKKTAGVTYTQGPPTYTVVEKISSEIAVDTSTGWVYQWHRDPGPTETGSWMRLGQGVDDIPGALPPSHIPTRNMSWFCMNNADPRELYGYTGSDWQCLTCGAGGTVTTDATLDGNGSGGSPLSIAQQGALEPQQLAWTGTTWEPSWGNPYVFVTSGASITSDVNEVLVGTVSGNVTFGLPSCNAALDTKHFKFVRNGTDSFSMTIDPSSAELFYDGASTKIIYGDISIDCTCRWNGSSGVWFYDNF